VALLVAASVVTSAPAAAKPCRAKGSGTVVETRAARVYVGGEYVWGCLFKVGRRVRLAPLWIDDLVRPRRPAPIRLAGRYVAFQSFLVDHYGYGNDVVATVDLRSGRTVHSWERSFDPSCGETKAIALLLTRRGSTAWTTQVDDSPATCGGKVTFGVMKADRSGTKVLDSGESVDPRSLRRDGDKISWRNGSSTRSATLH
jgi:hypothetical protein